MYIDNIIIFYFLFCRDSSITWQAIFNQGDVVGSQAWTDGRTKTNITPKNIHTLFFLVVEDFILFYFLRSRLRAFFRCGTWRWQWRWQRGNSEACICCGWRSRFESTFGVSGGKLAKFLEWRWPRYIQVQLEMSKLLICQIFRTYQSAYLICVHQNNGRTHLSPSSRKPGW